MTGSTGETEGSTGVQRPADAARRSHLGFSRSGFSRSTAGIAILVGCFAVAGCTTEQAKVDPKLGVSPSERVVGENDQAPDVAGRYHLGKAYTIGSKTYVPKVPPAGYQITGTASWYGPRFHGRKTANGEVFDKHSISAAHPTMPLPSYIRVTNLQNGKSMIVRVNDRGPFHSRRVVDVSQRVAEMLEFRRMGSAKVKVEYIGPARLDGHDDEMMLASLRGPDAAPAHVPSESRTLMIASADARAPVKTATKPKPAAPQFARANDRGAGRVVPVAAKAPAASPARATPAQSVPAQAAPVQATPDQQAPAAASIEIAAAGFPMPLPRGGSAVAPAADALPMLASADPAVPAAATDVPFTVADAAPMAVAPAADAPAGSGGQEYLVASAAPVGTVEAVRFGEVALPLPRGYGGPAAAAPAPVEVAYTPAASVPAASVLATPAPVAVAPTFTPAPVALAGMPLPRPAAGSIDALLADTPAPAPPVAAQAPVPVAETHMADAGRFTAPASSPSSADADQLQALLARYVADGVIQ